MMTTDPPRIRRPRETARSGFSAYTILEQEARAAKAAATSKARGATLWFDGYTMTPTNRWAIYIVTTPERIDKHTGEFYVTDYTVDVMGQTCNCDDFMHHGFNRVCKHLTGADNAVVAAHAAVEAARVLLTPREDAQPVTPRPMPKMPLPYEDRGATRRNSDKCRTCRNAAVPDALTNAAVPDARRTAAVPDARWNPNMLPEATLSAMSRAGVLNRAADFD